ncbi:MAG: hypothetical protein JST01_26090 [Cyanobacteria bacterium SZAS TMP-1]|nr:hypothetical protein [Cyanobacteria bacterium SZAS TMP-1]
MKRLLGVVLAMGAWHIACAEPTAEVISSRSMLFGAVADDECDENTFKNEDALLAAWAAKFAINSVVGFASSYLDKATEAQTVTRVATAPGHFYAWSVKNKTWLPNGGCIRFWYGARGNLEQPITNVDFYGASPAGEESAWGAISRRWAKLGFVEQPYLYGEVRLVHREYDNTMVLQPVVLFARKPREGRGFLRDVSRLAVALDIKALSPERTVATHTIELPDVSSGAVLVRGTSGTTGLASAWATMPAAPSEAARPREKNSGPFTALVTFTSTTDGTLFGKTVAATFKAQKEELVTALTPVPKKEREANEQAAMTAAFDAVAAVLEAQKTLDAAEEADKPKLAVELLKAKYLANLKLNAAGLPSRYVVAGP